MGLKVYWTETSINKLEDIFDYCKTSAGIDVAPKIVDSIIDTTIALENQPRTG